MYPTFLERYWHFSPGQRAWISARSMMGAIVGGIVFGVLSDRWGRRRMIVIAMMGALVAVPLWAFAPSAASLMAGAMVMQSLIQGAMGIVPAHLSELAPNSARGFLVGFGYQCGVLLSSSVVYFEAMLVGHMSFARTMAVTASTVILIAIIATAVGPERHGSAFNMENPAGRPCPSCDAMIDSESE